MLVKGVNLINHFRRKCQLYLTPLCNPRASRRGAEHARAGVRPEQHTDAGQAFLTADGLSIIESTRSRIGAFLVTGPDMATVRSRLSRAVAGLRVYDTQGADMLRRDLFERPDF
jgi:hypothetical protein